MLKKISAATATSSATAALPLGQARVTVCCDLMGKRCPVSAGPNEDAAEITRRRGPEHGLCDAR
jgi:hypothetical protein